MARYRNIAILLTSVMVPGCVSALGAGTRAERSRGAGVDGAGTPDSSAVSSAGPSIPGSREICGNGVDDDGNGQIDEGCACAAGTSRACYIGPPSTRAVGICQDGVQQCNDDGEFGGTWGQCVGSVGPTTEIAGNGLDDNCNGVIDEAGGICVPTETQESHCGDGQDNDCDGLVDCADPDCSGDAACPASCAASETTCFGGVDDDCDGLVDCADPDCSGSPSCAPSPCAPGETPTYGQRDLGTSFGPSSIEAGDHGAVMTMTCEPSGCAPGMDSVEVVMAPDPSSGGGGAEGSGISSPDGRGGTSAPMTHFICVGRAPTCPGGSFPTYNSHTSAWECDSGCDYVVHYGSLYGGDTVCAGPPPICSGGDAPTFVFEQQDWSCQPMCDGGAYDPHTVGGVTVCVPC